jgi:hypothetical protein
MGLNFGAGLPSAGESPRGGDHGDRQKHWKVDDRQGRSTCPHAAIELKQTLSMEWHRLQAFCREFATLFPALLGGKNACNWAIPATGRSMAASARLPNLRSCRWLISRRTATRPSIFIQPITRSSKSMIHPKAGAAVASTKSCLTCRIGRRRKDPEILLMPHRAAGGAVKAWAMPA